MQFILNRTNNVYRSGPWLSIDFNTKETKNSSGDEFGIDLEFNRNGEIINASLELDCIPKKYKKMLVETSSIFENITDKDKVVVNIDRDSGPCLLFIGYDPKTDSAHFSFNKNKKKGIGIDLGKGVVIRIDPKTNEWLGVSLFGISKILAASKKEEK